MPKSPDPESNHRGPAPTRREFLAVGGAAIAAAAAADEFGGQGLTPRFVARLRRDRDMLAIDLEFVHFRAVGGVLRAADGGRARVIAHFPPQNLAEALFDSVPKGGSIFEVELLPDGKAATAAGNSPVPPVRSYLSGPSRVVFAAPAGAELPLAGGGPGLADEWLRRLAGWNLVVPAELGPDAAYKPRPPRWDETGLELPYRVIIAPRTGAARWLTSSERLPFDPADPSAAELWNAQLLSRVKVTPAALSADLAGLAVGDPNLAPLADITLQARPIFSPDYQAGADPGIDAYYPGKQPLSLHSLTRHRLVKQMSTGRGWIDVDHLVLTALGSDAFLAYFNPDSFDAIIAEQLRSAVPDKATADKAEKAVTDTTLMVWKHRMVVGRDVYFVEAFFGVLFPMVFPSLYVEVTRREFAARETEPGKNGPPGAYLLKRRYIVVRQPDKAFTGSGSPLGRRMPLKAVVLGASQSPDLAPLDSYPIENDLTDASFLPAGRAAGRPLLFVPRAATGPAGGAPLEWPLTLTDESGRQAKTPHAVLLFAGNVVLGQKAWDKLKPAYREWKVPPQPLALAPETATIKVTAAADPHPLAPEERDGVGRLGEGLQRWQTLVGSAGSTAELARFARLPAYLTTLEAAFRGLPGAWTGTEAELAALYKSFPKTGLTAQSEAQVLSLIDAKQGKLRGAAGEAAGRVRAEAARLAAAAAAVRPETLAKVRDGIAAAATAANLRSLHEPMRAAEKVSAILETHKITFGSTVTGHRFGPYAAELAKLGTTPTAADLTTARKNAFQFPMGVEERSDIKAAWAEIGDEIAAVTAGTQTAAAYAAWVLAAAAEARSVGAHRFHAVVEQVEGIVPSMKAMYANYPVEKFVHLPEYIDKGIHDVADGIFAKVVRDAGGMDVARLKEIIGGPAAAVRNGLATPKTLIQGLSNQLGAVAAADLAHLKKLADPLAADLGDAKALAEMIPDARLFGVLPLKSLVAALARGELPSINLVKTPEELTHTWKWTLPIKAEPVAFPPFVTFAKSAKADGKLALHIRVLTTTKLPKPQQALAGEKPVGLVQLDAYLGLWDSQADRPDPPAANTAAFEVTILQMIVLKFRQVRVEADYQVGESPKPRVTPEIAAVDFVGPLLFVKKFQEALGNLGGGFKVALTPRFIELSYAFLLPPISFGAFSLRNILLKAGLMLPLGDEPLRFSFGLSSFAVPFELTVMCFGGRGFLRVEIDTKGNRDLEGALEFGGSLAFDVGVASGGLYVMAGVYFKITKDQTDLAGYLRAGGTLDVLGLLHATVEFLLMVTWRKTKDGSELYGTATLTVSIEMLFFSLDVHVTMEKRIAGSKDSDSGGQASLGGSRRQLAARSGAATFVSHRVADPSDRPRAEDRTYFLRTDYPPLPDSKPNSAPPKGRFRTAREWLDDYWCQFDLSHPTGA